VRYSGVTVYGERVGGFYIVIDTKDGTEQALEYENYDEVDFYKETDDGVRIYIYTMSNHPDQSYSVPPRVFFIPETHPLFNLYRIELSNDLFEFLKPPRGKVIDASVKEELLAMIK
jgi:hypothetical protein